jgi:hypothetical protein
MVLESKGYGVTDLDAGGPCLLRGLVLGLWWKYGVSMVLE